jgi:acyl-coenzyme A synthetase/AMP-(fatty) acid ligase
MAALVARATVVFAPFEAGSAGAFVDDQQITSAYIGPTPMRLIQSKGGLSHPGWSRLRSVLTGGERLDGDTAALMLDRFPDKVFLGYGATEVTRIAEATAVDIAQHPGTVGRVLPLHQVQIVELGGTTPVAAGNQGEVLARGGSMFSGYLGEGPADEWYRTGDVGYLDADGFLYITGRATEVVQIGGNRVSTNEITSLLRSHADLADALVVAVDDPIWGSRLEGFVVAAPGTTVETAALESWLRGRVSAYKVPRRIHLLEQIPLDPSGKASLRTLADLARS